MYVAILVSLFTETKSKWRWECHRPGYSTRCSVWEFTPSSVYSDCCLSSWQSATQSKICFTIHSSFLLQPTAKLFLIIKKIYNYFKSTIDGLISQTNGTSKLVIIRCSVQLLYMTDKRLAKHLCSIASMACYLLILVYNCGHFGTLANVLIDPWNTYFCIQPRASGKRAGAGVNVNKRPDLYNRNVNGQNDSGDEDYVDISEGEEHTASNNSGSERKWVLSPHSSCD